MTWTLVWKLARNQWVRLAACCLFAFVAGLLVAGRRSSAPGPTPYTAEPTKRAAEAPTVVEELPVVVIKPAPKVRERIAAEYRQPGILAPAAPQGQQGEEVGPIDGQLIAGSAFAKEIVSEVKFEPAPAGGTALTTVDRATGLVETTIRPRPEPLISFANRWRILGAYGQFEDREPIIRAQLEWWPVKVRRLEFGAAAGWERTDRGRAYVLAQVAVVPR